MSRAKNLANFQTTITDGTTSVATSTAIDRVKNGAAKSWVNFNGSTVTNASDLTGVDQSFNISSVVDNNTGRYTPSQTNSFANANYVITHGALYAAGNGWFHSYFNKTTANVEFLFISTLGSYTDSTDVSIIYTGDLA